MRIAICEDDAAASERLSACLDVWSAAAKQPLIREVYTGGEALLRAMERGEAFDIAFLDIHLRGKRDGIQIAQAIRLRERDMLLVFVTNFMDYVLRGYEVRALRYLIKPVKQRDLDECMRAALAVLRGREQSSLTFASAGGHARIPYADILYFEVFSHTIMLHAYGSRQYAFSERIGALEQQLPDGFVRCHRSYIVNIRHVFAIRKTVVELANSQELPISERRRDALHEAFLRYRV